MVPTSVTMEMTTKATEAPRGKGCAARASPRTTGSVIRLAWCSAFLRASSKGLALCANVARVRIHATNPPPLRERG